MSWPCFSLIFLRRMRARVPEGGRVVSGLRSPPGAEPGCLACMRAVPGMRVCFGWPWGGRGGALGEGGWLPALTGQNLLGKEAGATEDSTRQTGERCSGQDGAGPPPAVWNAVGPFKGALFLGVHLYPPPPSLSCPSRNLSRPHLASPPPSRGRGRALCVQGPGLWRRLFPLRGSSVSPRGDAFN